MSLCPLWTFFLRFWFHVHVQQQWGTEARGGDISVYCITSCIHFEYFSRNFETRIGKVIYYFCITFNFWFHFYVLISERYRIKMNVRPETCKTI
jgi:hypothetical protein